MSRFNSSHPTSKEIMDTAINVASMTGATDSDKIGNAIALAVSTGKKVVMIPQISPINGSTWLIDRAILLPSNLTLILNNCYLKLNTGVKDNIITNAGARTTPLTSNTDIHILGIGNAFIDGDGNNNHFTFPQEQHSFKRVGILLFNTSYFSVKNIIVRNTQGWGMSCEHGCHSGLIENIRFRQTANIENQDGIDIRKGCHDITIQNIYGATGDDVVALTGLRYQDIYGETTEVGGLDTYGSDNDIYRINIRNIHARTCGCVLVRMTPHNGVNIYDIDIDGVYDNAPRFDTVWTHSYATVLVGDNGYWMYDPVTETNRPSTKDELRNINIRNVYSHAVTGVMFRWSCRDVSVSNVKCEYDIENGIEFVNSLQNGGYAQWENIKIDNVFFNRYQAASYGGTAYTPANWKGRVIGFTGGGTFNAIDIVLNNFTINSCRYILYLPSCVTNSTNLVSLILSNFNIGTVSNAPIYDTGSSGGYFKAFLSNWITRDRNNIYTDNATYTTKLYTQSSINVLLKGNMPVLNALDNTTNLTNSTSQVTITPASGLSLYTSAINKITKNSDGLIVVNFDVYSESGDNITPTSVIFTLPIGYRPSLNVYTPVGYYTVAAEKGVAWGVVTSDGSVIYQGAVNTKYVNGTLSYYIS